MKKILILGSTGMLGSQVLRALQKLKDFKIYATYKNNKKLSILKKTIKINSFTQPLIKSKAWIIRNTS